MNGVKVIFNIGAEGSGILNTFPMFFDGNSFKDFSDWIRAGMFDVMTWAHDYNVPIGRLCLYLHIHEDITGNMEPRKSTISDPTDEDYYYDWNMIVHCKNVREYKQFLNLKWDEIEQMMASKKREAKINSIIDE